MTLPKKKRRHIEVDGVTYHYLVRFEKSERAVIQLDSGRGACLFVFPHSIMQPKHVADSIRFGIQMGWNPELAGNDVWLAFDCGSDNESLLEYIPKDDFRVVTYHTHGELPKNADATRFADTRKWYDRKILPDNLN